MLAVASSLLLYSHLVALNAEIFGCPSEDALLTAGTQTTLDWAKMSFETGISLPSPGACIWLTLKMLKVL